MANSATHPLLILGLGTGATQLIEMYEPASPDRIDHPGFRVETLDSYGVGYDGWDFDREVLKTLLDGAEIVLLVVGAGGKAGSAMATFAAEYAVSQKISVDVLLSKPYSWEGRRRMATANTLAENLRAVSAKVTVMDADQLQTTEFDSASEAFAALNSAMAQELNRWVTLAK